MTWSMSRPLRRALVGLGGLVMIGLAAWLIYHATGTDTVTYKLNGPANLRAEVFTIQVDLMLGPLGKAAYVNLPWETTIFNDHLTHPAVASMRAETADRGALLTCEVWVNGIRMDQRSASGAVGCLYDPNQPQK